MITDVHIEQWLDARGVTDPAMREKIRDELKKLRGQGKLDLQTVGIKTKMTVEKFDKEQDPPVLVETVISEESGQTIVSYHNGEVASVIKKGVNRHEVGGIPSVSDLTNF